MAHDIDGLVQERCNSSALAMDDITVIGSWLCANKYIYI